MDYNGNTQSFNVNSFNSLNILHATVPDNKIRVPRCLSSLEPQKRHQHLRESRLNGVGQWIFRTAEFRRWNMGEDGSSHSVLFCHGDPGVGKTHLSSLVMDYFYGRRQDIIVAGLYCDYLNRNDQTVSNMLGAMLKQLVGSGKMPEEIRHALEDAEEHLGGVSLEISELLKMLKLVIAQRKRVVICIDGLDESLAPNRTGLLSSLQTIVKELPNVRLFLTARPFIRGEVERYFPGVDTISVSPTKEDIEAFLRTKLDGDTEPDAMDERLRANIMEIIPKKISEIFLLVSLSIEAILGETTIHRREEKLKQISKGQDIGDLYNATFTRIKAQKPDRSRLGMEAIMWVAHSERPLRPEELCQALAIEIGSHDLNSRNVPSIRTILNCGLGLVTVDSSSSTVRLVHFTLQEYILTNPTLFLSPHLAIAEVCLTYLNFGCIRGLSPALSSPPPTAPFLEYASCHWGAHARRETNETVISLALKLLDQFDTHISCKLLLLKQYHPWRPTDTRGKPFGFTGLHGGALIGVVEIMVPLLEVKRWDFNAADLHGKTALAWAAREGHDGIVKMLLEREEVNPDAACGRGETPLSCAAGYGRVGIVKMLLQRRDVNPNTADERGETPLSRATSLRSEGAAMLLLERNDVDPDTADEDGRTALSYAAETGCFQLVKLLLERNDVSPNRTDNSGTTPFSWAAQSGQEVIIATLLERGDVNPDSADESGRTPLSRAAGEGNFGVVDLLLECNNVNPDMADGSGRTPLSWAAEWGNFGVVDLLLECDNVNPDMADGSGRTPLSWAAQNWNVEIVTMLLERGRANPDTVDKRGRTPFSWAAAGWAEVLNDVDPTSEGNSDRTQYYWATKNQCERTAKMLLDRKGVNPDAADKSGRTPLSWATSHGHEEIVRMLLVRNDVNPDRADERGRTPLFWAIMYEHEEVVKMLLERSDVNPNTQDKSGQTPLAWAAENGCEEIVEALLERGDVNPNTPDESGRTPLALAAVSGHEEIVKMLLERNDGATHDISTTPFSRAATGGHDRIAEVLFGWNHVSPETVNDSDRKPHPWAAENGCAGGEQLLWDGYDSTTKSVPREELFESFRTKPSKLPEPPSKKIRRF